MKLYRSNQIYAVVHVINRARMKLETEGIKPKRIRLSPNAHEMLVKELNKRDGKKHVRVYEIMGMTVDIEDECPAGTGYIEGEDEG